MIITLTTDFGDGIVRRSDEGVYPREYPGVRLVDLAHERRGRHSRPLSR